MEQITITNNFDRDLTIDENIKDTIAQHFDRAEKVNFVNTYYIVQWSQETEIYTIRTVVFDKGTISITCTRQ